MFSFKFIYNKDGYGVLALYDGASFLVGYDSRTGSLRWKDEKDKSQGVELVNNIVPGKWTIRVTAPPVDTTEKGMYIKKGQGWKVRLYNPQGKWTHYLIHPDGNKPGTLGCIGLQNTDARQLKERISQILENQIQIPVNIQQEDFVRKPKNPTYKKSVSVKKAATDTALTGGTVLAVLPIVLSAIGVDVSYEDIVAIAGAVGIIKGAIKGIQNWWKNK